MVVLDVDGTLPQYDDVLETTGCPPTGRSAAGGLFHRIAVADGGVRITVVGQERETFNSFADHQLRLSIP